MGIDFYDKWVEDEIKDRERIGGDMYDHRDDYIKRDKYNKLDEKFEKAKEIIRDFLSVAVDYIDKEDKNYSFIVEAEQFLNGEVEK